MGWSRKLAWLRQPKRLLGSLGAVVLLPIVVVTAPVWLPVAAAVDLLTGLRRLPTIRLGLFAVVYMAHAWVAIISSIWLWLLGGFGRRLQSPQSMERHRKVQRWWAWSLLDWARRLLNVHLEFPDPAELPQGAFILASRHVSMVDAILPIPLVTGMLDRFVHYILKDELRWDPAIGSYGPRLNNVFVARGDDTEGDLSRIQTMATDAQPDSVLVIFPEGTYATVANRRRILASLERKAGEGRIEPAALERAQTFRHLLPPKTLGIIELQNVVPNAPVVIMGHVGLEGVSELQGLRKRMPLQRPVVLRWWVFTADEVPADDIEFASWLHETWLELDNWVHNQLHPVVNS